MTPGRKVDWQNSSYLHTRSCCISVQSKAPRKECTSLCKSSWFMEDTITSVLSHPGSLRPWQCHFEKCTLWASFVSQITCKICITARWLWPQHRDQMESFVEEAFLYQKGWHHPHCLKVFLMHLSHVYFLLVLHIYIFFNSFASKGHFKVMPKWKKHLMETHVSLHERNPGS